MTWVSYGFAKVGADSDDALDAMWGKLATSHFGSLLSSFVKVLLYGGAGFYLIKSGRLIFKWVYPPEEEPFKTKEPQDQVP